MSRSTFSERRTVIEAHRRKDAWTSSAHASSGTSETIEVDGRTELRWSPASTALDPARTRLTLEALESAGNAIAGTAGGQGVHTELALRAFERAIDVTTGSIRRQDTQRWVLVELRVRCERNGEVRQLQREAAFSDVEALFAALPSLKATAADAAELARLRLEDEPVQTAELPVVIPPGADAGVFFHEVLGHPLEGDVVARRASYLAERLGDRIAPAFVTVVDDPTRGPGAVCYAWDDEGAPAGRVALLDQGRVGEPLLDARTAKLLGREPNGHARRASFRHPALPRMAHTELRPHAGAFEDIVGEVEEGVLISYLTPRHVNLWTGAFSFYVVEARRIRNGAVGPFLRPCLLRGDGPGALGAIERVGADLATFFGLKGCGKLDQGELPVSFGNPTVRFARLRLRPQR